MQKLPSFIAIVTTNLQPFLTGMSSDLVSFLGGFAGSIVGAIVAAYLYWKKSWSNLHLSVTASGNEMKIAITNRGHRINYITDVFLCDHLRKSRISLRKTLEATNVTFPFVLTEGALREDTLSIETVRQAVGASGVELRRMSIGCTNTYGISFSYRSPLPEELREMLTSYSEASHKVQ